MDQPRTWDFISLNMLKSPVLCWKSKAVGWWRKEQAPQFFLLCSRFLRIFRRIRNVFLGRAISEPPDITRTKIMEIQFGRDKQSSQNLWGGLEPAVGQAWRDENSREFLRNRDLLGQHLHGPFSFIHGSEWIPGICHILGWISWFPSGSFPSCAPLGTPRYPQLLLPFCLSILFPPHPKSEMFLLSTKLKDCIYSSLCLTKPLEFRCLLFPQIPKDFTWKKPDSSSFPNPSLFYDQSLA